MNGLELSESYFEEFGKPMLERDFPDLLPHLAAGLCGSGSECFGFDDEVSRDHDFEPGFLIFLPGEDTVSRIHARIFFKEEGWFLIDLNSKNGTWADEERLKPQEEKRLEDGDRILFGSVSYTVRSLTEERTELLPG